MTLTFAGSSDHSNTFHILTKSGISLRFRAEIEADGRLLPADLPEGGSPAAALYARLPGETAFSPISPSNAPEFTGDYVELKLLVTNTGADDLRLGNGSSAAEQSVIGEHIGVMQAYAVGKHSSH